MFDGIGRRALVIAVVGLVACDSTITLGYNETGLGVETCGPDASFRACSTESCVVSQVTAAEMGRETIAVDSEFLYFLSAQDVIGRIPKSGGSVVPLATGVAQVERLTIDEENLYWTDYNGEVSRVPKDGSAAATLVTKVFGHPISIATDREHLYLALTDSGEIAMIPKPDGTATLLAGQGTPIDLGIDAEHVYWIDQGEPGTTTGALVRAPLGDLTGAEVILSGLEEPLILGITSEAILWATYDKVFRLSRGGGPPRTFDVDFGEPKGVTERDGIVYVAGERGLHRIRLDDGSTLRLDARGFTGITLGCDGLYAVGWFDPILVRYGP